MPFPRNRIPVLFGTSGGVKYLMKDEFTTDLAAGAVNGTTAEPGPGTRVVADTLNLLSLSSGDLVLADGGPDADGNPCLWESGIARAAGKGALFRAYVPDTNLKGPEVGWSTSQLAAGIPAGHQLTMNGWNGVNMNFNGECGGGSLSTLGYATQNAYYSIAVILRASGAFYLIKGGTIQTVYHLVWVDTRVNTATMYPFVQTRTRINQVPFLRVADLTQVYGGLSTEFGMATAVNETPATGATLTAKADAFIEFTWTPVAGETMSIYFRRTDDDNTWRMDCAQADNTIKLYKRESGVDTEVEAGATQSWTAGTPRIIQISLFGDRVLTFVGGISKHNRVDNYNQTATGVKVTGFATGADLVAWPAGSGGEWSDLDKFFL